MSAGRVVIYGGKGALGSACVDYFKANNYVSLKAFHFYFYLQLRLSKTNVTFSGWAALI